MIYDCKYRNKSALLFLFYQGLPYAPQPECCPPWACCELEAQLETKALSATMATIDNIFFIMITRLLRFVSELLTCPKNKSFGFHAIINN